MRVLSLMVGASRMTGQTVGLKNRQFPELSHSRHETVTKLRYVGGVHRCSHRGALLKTNSEHIP